MILIIDCGSQKTPYIERIVDEFMDFETVKILDFTNEHLHHKLGVIISGAPLLITEMDMTPYLQKMKWIKETTIPVFGICFGHQIIGLTFGGYGARMREDRDFQIVEVFEECLLFDKLPTEIEMMEDHCETISIPPRFKLIASSDVCINEAMQHTELPVFGVQFHPEVSGNHGQIIFQNFINYCEKFNNTLA
ncbi:MAG: gamma-glutamyl-gamma-aminobutyrate hydrolase family protein [Flavobacteriia bacterium]|nr:gamma-glutamyl-gamma-aminobutyrate hydrolase family protein [Flavobacteriia bacterium]